MGGSQFEVIEKRRTLPNLGAVDLRHRPLLEHITPTELQPILVTGPNPSPKSRQRIRA
jgi:hypothetical protein